MDYAVVVVMGQNGHNDTYKDCRVLWLLLTTLVTLTTENDRLRAIYCLLKSCYKTWNAFITSFNETLIFCNYKAYLLKIRQRVYYKDNRTVHEPEYSPSINHL